MGGETSGLSQLCVKGRQGWDLFSCMVKTHRKGAVLPTRALCTNSAVSCLSPSFSVALSCCHVTCQKQMKIERIRLKIELNSISQPNSEVAFGNTVQYS